MPPTTGRRARLIVLNYNGGAFLRRCFDSLLALEWPAGDLELVLIDNASTDDSATPIETAFPDVRVIHNDENTGFPANNLALGDLDGLDYVGLVNSDGFVEPGWLTALADALDADAMLGAVAAKILFAPRFVDVTIDSPTFSPGIGDPRDLGVMVSGLRAGGTDRWADTQFGEGSWGPEAGRGGTFHWTKGRAVLRVPLPEPVAARPGAASGRGFGRVEILVEAETTKRITLTSGRHTMRVEVGTTPRWLSIDLDGEPYDVIQNAGSMVFDDGAGADRGFRERDDGQFDEPAEVFAWCGGSVLFRPSYVRETGVFDERFFLYYEDTDWAWRGRGRGWRYQFVPTAVMRHIHAASSVEGSAVFAYHVERNRLLMLTKNAPLRFALHQVWRYLLVTASYLRRDVVGALLRGRRPNTRTVRRRVKSFLGYLSLVPAMLITRRDVRRRQTVPHRTLLAWLVHRDDP